MAVEVNRSRKQDVRNVGITDDFIKTAAVIWEYMLMHDKLEKSELILVFGSNDIRVAQYGAKLWLQGYGNYIMFSGHFGNFTRGKWSRPECEIFRDEACKMGVPNNRILLETKASNTGENVTFSYNVLKILNLVPRKSIILVHTPYMERRTYATFMKQWPEMITSLKVHVTSPPIPLKDYPAEDIGSLQVIIGVMLGCLQRIMVYPSKGYHIYQRIPDNVREAYEILIKCNLFNNFTVL